MTVEAYPGFLEGRTYSAEITRRALNSLMQRGATIGSGVGGLVSATDCKTNAVGGSLKVQVEPGELWVPGSNITSQGSYYTRVTAGEVLTPPAAHATLPRIETVVMRVKDKAYTGTEDLALIELLKGTATSGATLADPKGKATPEPNSYSLAYVLIPPTATVITSTEILNIGTMVKLTTPPWGRITEGAAIESGTGDFTVSKLATGEYEIIWNVARPNNKYAVFITPLISGGSPCTPVSSLITAASFRVNILVNNVAKNQGFAFTVLGG